MRIEHARPAEKDKIEGEREKADLDGVTAGDHNEASNVLVCLKPTKT